MSEFRIATRASDLAVTQCGDAARLLRESGLNVRIETVTTHGDVDRRPLTQMGGIGVFAGAIRTALLEGEADIAVHSFKDLPTAEAAGLTIGAVPRRADPRDALCARDGLTFDELPEGATIGTGSPRRAAQLLQLRSDVRIVDIRGNVPTRLGRVAGNQLEGAECRQDLDAVILAKSGLERLNLGRYITDVFHADKILPAPAQGALAVECRSSDLKRHRELAAAMTAINDPRSRCEAWAERAVLERLMAGCAAPVGAYALATPSSTGKELNITLRAAVIATDGSQRVASTMSTSIAIDCPAMQLEHCAATLGHSVGEHLLEQGAAGIADLQASTMPRRASEDDAAADASGDKAAPMDRQQR